VVINEALASAAFRERDPIGRVIIAGYDSMDPMTIVGVVGDVRQYGPAREPQPEIYMPYQATLLQRRDAICRRESGDGFDRAWSIDPSGRPASDRPRSQCVSRH
jgi:hypothetical protein